MKTFSSEIGHNYDTYSFGYCQYAERESNDRLMDIYAAGYLPFSGSPDVANLAYMARSVRLDLKVWMPNSENRRIYRKFENVERQIDPVSQHSDDAAIFDFCLAYFAARHGSVMPADRLRYVLNSGWVTDIATYRIGGNIAAYVWLGRDEEASHFYYSFYDLSFVSNSLGLWLMIDLALKSQELKHSHLYLGTAYGEKGLYKTNFEPLCWWNGRSWQTDREGLRSLCRADDTRILTLTDRWKEDANLF